MSNQRDSLASINLLFWLMALRYFILEHVEFSLIFIQDKKKIRIFMHFGMPSEHLGEEKPVCWKVYKHLQP